MTSASPAERPAIGEPVAPTCSSLPDQPTNRSKVCQVKIPILLGSSSSIADSKAVKETLKGNFDEGPALEECFEFENSSYSIQSVKGRLKAHFAFWADALGANDFILRVIDKGYAIPFITFPPNALFDNNHSALMHADLFWRLFKSFFCQVQLFKYLALLMLSILCLFPYRVAARRG